MENLLFNAHNHNTTNSDRCKHKNANFSEKKSLKNSLKSAF